jgi:hypothetical protein
MNDVLRQAAESFERLRSVKIADDRHDSERTQRVGAVLGTRQRENAPAPAEFAGHAQSDVTAADDQ